MGGVSSDGDDIKVKKLLKIGKLTMIPQIAQDDWGGNGGNSHLGKK